MTKQEIDIKLWKLLGRPEESDLLRFWYDELMRLTNAERRRRKRKKYVKSGVPRVSHLPAHERKLAEYRALQIPPYG